jgi:glutaminyl-tRNA synthetase
VIKDDNGQIVELRCSYDPATRGGNSPDGRKVKSTIHWVSATHALRAEVRLYDHLFAKERPEDTADGEDFKSNLNPESLTTLSDCMIEPSLKDANTLDRFQFERLGYFCLDRETAKEKMVFNRTVTLRDTWAKIQKKGK